MFVDHTMDVNIRWQAVLYFKNGVDRSVSKHRTANQFRRNRKQFSGIGGKMPQMASVMRRRLASGQVS